MFPKCNNCTLEEQAIINIIRSNPMIKQEEIANMINKSLRAVKTMVSCLGKEIIDEVFDSSLTVLF